MLLGMFVISSWVSNEIKANVTDNAAVTTALFLDSFIAPLAQDLENSDRLSIGQIRALDEIMSSDNLRKRIISIKIWKKGGLIAYSNTLDLVGKKFSPTISQLKAWDGQVVAEFDELDDPENVYEREAGIPLIEIYSPVRHRWSGRIIAVAEFYASAADLQENIKHVIWKSWLAVGSFMLVMSLSLFGIVRRASLLIGRQREALQLNVEEAKKFATQNRQLRQRIERASSRHTQLNERYLRRISAELHDGPAQLLGLASLRLDSICRNEDPQSRLTETGVVSQALADAMRDIRNICVGLSLPEIESDSLEAVIKKAIRAHEQRTGTTVASRITRSAAPVPSSIKICVYRFVQEGLNNAFRHADGNGQSVSCTLEENVLHATVVDHGGRGLADKGRSSENKLGLAGLRDRVESLGGYFRFESVRGRGSRLEMAIAIQQSNEETYARTNRNSGR